MVGVVDDFRVKTPLGEDKISPMVMRNQPQEFAYISVKIISNDITGTLIKLQDKWSSIDPAHAFKYEFYEQQLVTIYQGIFDVVSILGFIAFLAITIACMGMLGMAIYTAERKQKEIGIRKVLGAANFSIAFLLSKTFLKVLSVSILLGAPFSYAINNLWLQKFPNRVEFGFDTVVISSGVLMILGLLTIWSQTLKAAKSNPVDTLKSE